MEKELPRNWCIKRNLTEEQNHIVTAWINNKYGYCYSSFKFNNSYYIWSELKGVDNSDYVLENYRELSFEEFEEQIINYNTYKKPKIKQNYNYLISVIKKLNKSCL